MKGTVAWISEKEGFGYVKPEGAGGAHIVFRIQDLHEMKTHESGDTLLLKSGDPVDFDVVNNGQGEIAVNIVNRLLTEMVEESEARHHPPSTPGMTSSSIHDTWKRRRSGHER